MKSNKLIHELRIYQDSTQLVRQVQIAKLQRPTELRTTSLRSLLQENQNKDEHFLTYRREELLWTRI